MSTALSLAQDPDIQLIVSLAPYLDEIEGRKSGRGGRLIKIRPGFAAMCGFACTTHGETTKAWVGIPVMPAVGESASVFGALFKCRIGCAYALEDGDYLYLSIPLARSDEKPIQRYVIALPVRPSRLDMLVNAAEVALVEMTNGEFDMQASSAAIELSVSRVSALGEIA